MKGVPTTVIARRQFRITLYTLCLATTMLIVLLCVHLDLTTIFFQPRGNTNGPTTTNGTSQPPVQVKYLISRSPQFVLDTEGCKIVYKDPWAAEFKSHFKKLLPASCPKEPEDILVYIEKDMIKINQVAKSRLLNGDKNADLYCRMWSIYRLQFEENDTSFRISDRYIEFRTETLVNNEYLLVKCYLKGTTVYQNCLFHIIKKKDVEDRCETSRKRFLQEHPQCDKRLSVLVLGVDSVSKMNFLRTFPQVKDLLRHTFDAVEFFGYNKIGLNTFPCLAPYLAGKSVTDLQQTCWGLKAMNKFDNCTFIFDVLASTGYRTAFVENLNDYGLFTYNRGGFIRKPVDYYGRTLYLAISKYVKKFYGGCWRGLSDDENLIQWAYEYQKRFSNSLHYGHFWISRFSHDNLNTAQHADQILTNYLVKMKTEGLLDNTLVIVMSDHGLRFGDFRETPMGRFEENLPFMFFIIPDWFKKEYPLAVTRLRDNGNRLVTLFDLHETIKSIANCGYKNESVVETEVSPETRGVSLFQKISPLRTCAPAGIPEIYCACAKEEFPIDDDSQLSNSLANTLLRTLNNITQQNRDVCEEFKIKSILSVKKVLNPDGVHSYVVSIETTPGDAKFEATITPEPHGGDMQFEVDKDIRRINMYGTTSHCISNNGILKQTCYCKKQ